MDSIDDGYFAVNLDFNFTYFRKTYTQVSISSNGYVCMGYNLLCGQITRPSPHEILVGLNFDLDTRRSGSGQIYYQNVSSDSIDFTSAKDYVNLLNSTFLPTNVFMITYDNILPYNTGLWNLTKFEIFLLSNNENSYVIFKYISCPTEIYLSLSGLNHICDSGNLGEIIFNNSQLCTASNVNQTGVWISEVTTFLGNII